MTMQKTANHPHKNLCSAPEVMAAYRQMLLIRRFEERCSQAYGLGLIAGFCHLYIGQEAVVVGVKSAMQKGDAMVTAYRDHGHSLVSGTDPRSLMAELFGKASGSSKGKGGSMHVFNVKEKFFGGYGIVGAQVPIGTGIAFAEKYKSTDNVCVIFMGDGAANQGQVYESFNMASLWQLPALYIIENNHYAMGTSAERGCATAGHLYERGLGFGIAGEKVNGMDFFAVKQATSKALAMVRTGRPYLLEMDTYRYKGHSMSDPAKYREKEELEDYKQHRDPLKLLEGYLIKHKLIKEEVLKKEDEEIRKIVLDAFEYAKNDQEPAAEELFTDVYVS